MSDSEGEDALNVSTEAADVDADAVAKRLREKIRLQAESLLNHVDDVQNARIEGSEHSHSEYSNVVPIAVAGGASGFSSAMTSPTGTAAASAAGTPGGASTPTGANTSSSLQNSPQGRIPPGRAGSCSSVTGVSAATSSRDLTKRLHKLALDRRREQQQDGNTRIKQIQDNTTEGTEHLISTTIQSFTELNLPKHLLDGVYAMGFDRPSYIQAQSLPHILNCHNVIGQAKSGSGKTAAFTLGMLYRVDVAVSKTQGLIVTPTRELAIQIVAQAIKPMGRFMTGLRVRLAIAQSKDKSGTVVGTDTAVTADGGGVVIVTSDADTDANTNDNNVTLKTAVPPVAHVVVGTPGKVVDNLKRKLLTASTIKVFVLDEADTMVDGTGHRANSLLIQKQLSKNCQCLLFSATFTAPVLKFAAKLISDPIQILIPESNDRPDTLVLDVIKQLWVDTREYDGGKLEFLADIYSLLTIGQSIVFVGRKKDADLIHTTLSNAGYTCSVLHSAIEPMDRDATMEEFRRGRSNVLITTNVLARGVDVDNVCLVINYDVPTTNDNEIPDFATYIHRIGRTGRFGRKGTAINLIQDATSLKILAAIESHFAQPGQEMIAQAPADPEALADAIEI